MRLLLGTLLAGIALASAAPAADFEIVRAAAGLSRPVYVTAPPGDHDRIFIVEQHSGQILILNLADDSINQIPFLTVGGIQVGSEQGLLGLAFHFDYQSNGYFFVNYTAAGATFVVRYQVSNDPNVADAGSAMPVLRFDQPASNHNGGWLGFASDDYLYISTGDGGGSNDTGTGHAAGGNAQDITDNLLGKILRIDVDGDDFPADPERNYAIPVGNPFVGVTGDDEIWMYGLRNPWRISFDRMTGDMWIGDVGQNNCEEINVQPAISSGGENYGWRLREGMIATPTGGVGGARPTGAVDPVFDSHTVEVSAAILAHRSVAVPSRAASFTAAPWDRCRACTSSPTTVRPISGRFVSTDRTPVTLTERTSLSSRYGTTTRTLSCRTAPASTKSLVSVRMRTAICISWIWVAKSSAYSPFPNLPWDCQRSSLSGALRCSGDPSDPLDRIACKMVEARTI